MTLKELQPENFPQNLYVMLKIINIDGMLPYPSRSNTQRLLYIKAVNAKVQYLINNNDFKRPVYRNCLFLTQT